MSDTPRTNFEEKPRMAFLSCDYVVASSFARQLERELNEAKAEVQRLNRFHVQDMEVTNKSASYHMQEHVKELQRAETWKADSERLAELVMNIRNRPHDPDVWMAHAIKVSDAHDQLVKEQSK